jgi:hypothetical protein
MGHDHHHHEDDTYFIDQLCMVGLSGAFGVICVCLFYFQRPMLSLLLGPQFHLFVVISGFALLALALARAVTLWRESQPASAIASLPVVAAHSHEHHHHHHDHGQDHHHDHDHHHHHDHSPSHAHDHSHDGHEHGWAPWRYVVLLVPIILFMLGLPNKPPPAPAYSGEGSSTEDVVRETSRIAGLFAADEWTRLARIGGENVTGDALPMVDARDFKRLFDSPNDPEEQLYLKDKTVRVRGQFSPNTADPRFFQLVRFQIGCCAGDLIPKPLSVFAREPITNVKRNEWAEVIGKVEYGKRGATTIVRLVTTATVQPKPPDPKPYMQ